jgi:hypothetical protein
MQVTVTVEAIDDDGFRHSLRENYFAMEESVLGTGDMLDALASKVQTELIQHKKKTNLTGFVSVYSKLIPIQEVELRYVEKHLTGRDLVTFYYDGDTHQSLITTEYESIKYN